MARRVRDSQRSRLYRAENGLFRSRDEPRFAAVPATQDYYDRLLGTAWFRRHHAVETTKLAMDVGDAVHALGSRGWWPPALGTGCGASSLCSGGIAMS